MLIFIREIYHPNAEVCFPFETNARYTISPYHEKQHEPDISGVNEYICLDKYIKIYQHKGIKRTNEIKK